MAHDRRSARCCSALLVIVAATGFLSHAAYQPGPRAQRRAPTGRDLQPFVFGWPDRPALALRAHPGPARERRARRRPAAAGQAVVGHPAAVRVAAGAQPGAGDRAPLARCCSSAGRSSSSPPGILNAQLYYPWHFNFVVAHYYGAWVFVAALAIARDVKLPVMVRAYRERGVLAAAARRPARTRGRAARARRPRAADAGGADASAAAACSRSSARASAGAAGGDRRPVDRRPAAASSRSSRRAASVFGDGPNDFPVNKTAAAARHHAGADRRPPGGSRSRGERATLSSSRGELLAMPQHTHDLPIACVEGWSTTQRWTGVRLARPRRARRRAAGARRCAWSRCSRAASCARPRSATPRRSTSARCWRCGSTAPTCSLDHGYPARIIVPALPGVHNTKWVASLTCVAS